MRALEEAINAYQQVVDARNKREKKIADLRNGSRQGGVKGNIAKAELDQILAEDQLERNKQEVTAAAKRRAAQRAVDSDKDGAKARERVYIVKRIFLPSCRPCKRKSEELLRRRERRRKKKKELGKRVETNWLPK